MEFNLNIGHETDDIYISRHWNINVGYDNDELLCRPRHRIFYVGHDIGTFEVGHDIGTSMKVITMKKFYVNQDNESSVKVMTLELLM